MYKIILKCPCCQDREATVSNTNYIQANFIKFGIAKDPLTIELPCEKWQKRQVEILESMPKISIGYIEELKKEWRQIEGLL